MKRCQLTSVLLGFLILCLNIYPVSADGIIIPDPPLCVGEDCLIEPFPISQLKIKYHHVEIKIDDQVSTTKVDQVFYNPNDWTIEGTYIFPVPINAVVTSFTLWVDGQPISGKVLSADEARSIYEEIVIQQRDPALLEYVGRGAVQASVFPIPPGGERRIELQYTEVLTAENGLVQYEYPLNTEKFSVEPLESVLIRVEVNSRQPIRAVYSPSHPISVTQSDNGIYKISYEAANIIPETDFVLHYSIGETEAFHLMSFRDPRDSMDPDGYFLMLLAPKQGEKVEIVDKEIILVLDRSGSMEGEKFVQAQKAARFILEHLNAGDHFGIVSFSGDISSFSMELQPSTEKDAAIKWLEGLSPLGSTDINRALLEGVNMVTLKRPAYLIFLTDGLPTEGETDSDDILNNIAMAAPEGVRLFSFGVGYDVDTYLLDSLSQEHHGRSSYVKPGEALDEKLSAFYAGINSPVLTDLELDFGGLSVYDTYPNPLPDLFAGSQILVVGRYREGGVLDVTLRGNVNGNVREFIYQDQLFASENPLNMTYTSKAIPRLWATRKIGYLLNYIRLNGADQEVIDQIVRLSIRYGIITPYTSYLVTEDMPLGAAAQNTLIENTYLEIQSAPLAPSYGQEAVDKAVIQGELERSESALPLNELAQQKVKIIGARTFVLINDVWVDSAFDPDTMVTIKVAFTSEDYLSLVRQTPDLAVAFGLGERVIAYSNGQFYEVVPANDVVQPIQITPVPTPLNTLKSEPSDVNSGTGICPTIFIPMALIVVVFSRQPRRRAW